MKKLLKRFSILTCLLMILILPYFVFASPEPAEITNNLSDVGTAAGFSADTNETSASAIAGTIVASVLSLLGVIFVALIIYAGITWMTAEGDEAKVEKAQRIMRSAIIGLIITVSAYAIYSLFNKLLFGY